MQKAVFCGFKRIVVSLFCVLAGVIGVGCGEAAVEEMVYEFSLQPLDVEMADWMYAEICQDEDTYYYVATDFDEGEARICITSVPRDGSASSVLWEGAYADLTGVALDGEGVFHLFLVRELQLTELLVDGKTGELISQRQYPSVCEEWLKQHEYLWPEVCADKTGTVYLYGNVTQDGVKGTAVWTLTPDAQQPQMQLFWEGERVQGVCGDDDGLILASTVETVGGSELILRKIQQEGTEQYCRQTMLQTSLAGMVSLAVDGEDVLLKDTDGLYRYDLTEDRLERMTTWTELDFVGNIVTLSSGKDQEVNGLAVISDKGYLLRLAQIPVSQQGKKQEVVLAGITSLDWLSHSAAVYNMQQTEYRIVLKDYSQSGQLTAQDALNKLNTDLMTGGQIDLICLNDLDVSVLIQKGYLRDLYDFMDEDSRIQKVDFVPEVRERMEYDGGLYRVFSTYQLRCLAGPNSWLQQAAPWDLETMSELAQNHMGAASLFYDVDRLDLLKQLFLVDRDTFVNMELGTCDFDGEEFLALLQMIKEMPIQAKTDNSKDIWDYVTEQKVLLQEVKLGSLREMEIYRQMYAGGHWLLGYPSTDGAAVLMEPVAWQLGICARSSHTDVAWNYLCYILENEKDKFSVNVFSVFQNAADQKRQEELTPVYIDGEKYAKVTEVFLNHAIPLYHGTEEDAEQLRQLLKQSIIPMDADVDIWSIVEEEVQVYLQGQISAENVAEIIQNRVQLLLDENGN